MAKNIKWGNKELPNVSFDELNKLTDAKLGMAQGAKTQLASGKHNFQLLDKETRVKRAKETTCFKDSDMQKKNSKKAHASKLESGYYKKNKEMHAALAKDLDQPWTCEHCNKSGRGVGNFKRYLHHTGGCLTTTIFKGVTLAKFKEIIKLLPETFSKKQVYEICDLNGYSSSLVSNLVDKSGMIECIHEGTYRSPKDPAIYKIKLNK